MARGSGQGDDGSGKRKKKGVFVLHDRNFDSRHMIESRRQK